MTNEMQKLTAHDLMLNDWVILYDRPRKVETIYDSGRVVVDCIEVECTELSPIPLTEEILEKNGFKECNKDTDGAIQYELGDEILGVNIWVNTEPCLLGAYRTWAGESQSYNMIDELPISFVHELQHALRMCNISKEIEL